MSSVIDSIERDQLRKGLPPFSPGDRVRVHFQVIEGNRKRTQVFEGVVLRRQGSGLRETFTVRKQSFGVGVERTFPLHSPKIEKLEVAARGDVRRAKLYYLRGRVGKAARVAERRWGIDEEMVSAPAATEAVDAEGVGQDEVVPVAEEEPEAGGAPEGEADAGDEAAATGAEVSEAQADAEAGEGSADDGDGAPGPDAAAPATEAAATEAESEAEEPAPEAEGEGGAEAEAAAPEAGETEDQAAPEDAEEEASAKADDSDEDPAA